MGTMLRMVSGLLNKPEERMIMMIAMIITYNDNNNNVNAKTNGLLSYRKLACPMVVIAERIEEKKRKKSLRLIVKGRLIKRITFDFVSFRCNVNQSIAKDS